MTTPESNHVFQRHEYHRTKSRCPTSRELLFALRTPQALSLVKMSALPHQQQQQKFSFPLLKPTEILQVCGSPAHDDVPYSMRTARSLLERVLFTDRPGRSSARLTVPA